MSEVNSGSMIVQSANVAVGGKSGSLRIGSEEIDGTGSTRSVSVSVGNDTSSVFEQGNLRIYTGSSGDYNGANLTLRGGKSMLEHSTGGSVTLDAGSSALGGGGDVAFGRFRISRWTYADSKVGESTQGNSEALMHPHLQFKIKLVQYQL